MLSIATDGKLPRGRADPEPGRDFDRIADRIDGKPAQAVHMTSEEQTTIRIVLLRMHAAARSVRFIKRRRGLPSRSTVPKGNRALP